MDGLRVTARVLTRAVVTATAICKAVVVCSRTLVGDHDPAAVERQRAPGRYEHDGVSPTIAIRHLAGTEY
jgi:hypothetical protein